MTLPAEPTATLLTTLPALYGATVNDVLLTALAVAVGRWRAGAAVRRRARRVLVDLEGHGREDVFDDVDLARTVGWFTTLFPVRVDPGAVDLDDGSRAAAPTPAARCGASRKRLRALPDRGLGYGILRQLDPSRGEQLGAAPTPQVLFNYLGRFAVHGRHAVDAGARRAAARRHARSGHADGPRARHRRRRARRRRRAAAEHGLRVAVGALRRGRHRRAGRAVDGGARGLHAHAALPGAGGHTPSDFPFVTLDQAEVDASRRPCPELQDVLPATALQEGLYFHALPARAPTTSTSSSSASTSRAARTCSGCAAR